MIEEASAVQNLCFVLMEGGGEWEGGGWRELRTLKYAGPNGSFGDRRLQK